MKIITIGSLIPRKGIDVLLNAFTMLKDQENVCLTIAGEGQIRESLQKLAIDNGLENTVQFVGDIKPDDIPEMLVSHDVFVLSSHSEGRPSVILEAMATGMPIIASNITGNNELIKNNETGLLFQDNNSQELATVRQFFWEKAVEFLGKAGKSFPRFRPSLYKGHLRVEAGTA